MVYLAVGIALITAGVGLVLWGRALSRRRMLRKVEAGVDMVKASLYRRLAAEHWREQDHEFASILAAAVVNEVFADDPQNDGERQFVEDNRVLIGAECRRLLGDQQLHHVVTQTLLAMVKANMLVARGRSAAKAAQWQRKLDEYHVVPSEEALPSFRDFIKLASEFEAAERTTVQLRQ